jgi:hypothetical protein
VVVRPASARSQQRENKHGYPGEITDRCAPVPCSRRATCDLLSIDSERGREEVTVSIHARMNTPTPTRPLGIERARGDGDELSRSLRVLDEHGAARIAGAALDLVPLAHDQLELGQPLDPSLRRVPLPDVALGQRGRAIADELHALAHGHAFSEPQHRGLRGPGTSGQHDQR